MEPYFQHAIEGLRDAATHLIAASQQIAAASQEISAAGSALVKTSEAVLHAKDEHEDLRETINRLESLVLEMRDRLNRIDPGGAA